MQIAARPGSARSLEALARDLLCRSLGDRLPTVSQYQELLGVGSGTVQARVRLLEEIRAIEVEPRGHQGTYLVARDVSELWSLARLGPVRGVLPLPEALEPVALAATLRQEFETLKIPLELLYLHGSRKRLEMVEDERAHFAVTSGPSAKLVIEATASRWHVYGFGPETYHRDDAMAVILRPALGADNRVVRIGIDPGSPDHTFITHAEFPQDAGYIYVPLPHGQLPAAVAEGTIDAAVWHRTSLAIPLSLVGVAMRPLHRAEAIAATHAMGHAVLVTRERHPEVKSILDSLRLDIARSVQDLILAEGTLPLY